MDKLTSEFSNLSPQQKRIVHLLLGELALAHWRDYCESTAQLAYVESVSGTSQVVDATLPSFAFACANEGCDIHNVARKYQEPIAALQDEDLTLPDSVTSAYYAIYNLFRKYALGEPIDDWLVVHQVRPAAEASRWAALVDDAIRRAQRDSECG